MAGGKKGQRKRQKKSWKSVLEEYLSNSPFVPKSRKQQNTPKQNSAQRHNPAQKQKVIELHKNSRKPVSSLGPPQNKRTSHYLDEPFLELPHDKQPPLRGILKKSPTLSSCKSPVCSEAAVGVPDSLLNSSSNCPQNHPAFLVTYSGNEDDICRNSQNQHYFSRYLNASAAQPQSSSRNCCNDRKAYRSNEFFNESDNIKGTRQSWKKDSTNPCNAFDPCYDTYNESYEALRNRLQQRYLGHKFHSSGSSRYVKVPPVPLESLTRGSHSHSQIIKGNREDNSRSLPKTTDRRPGPMIPPRSSSSEDTYVELQEIQRRKIHQRNLLRNPFTESLSQGPDVCFKETRSFENPIYQLLRTAAISAVPPIPKRLSEFLNNNELEDNSHSSDEATGVDPNLPSCTIPDYSNVTSFSRGMERPIQQDQFPKENYIFEELDSSNGNSCTFLPTRDSISYSISDVTHNSIYTTCSNDPEQRVEVAHIYATLERSSKKSATSSYIYASISWKTSHQSEKVLQESLPNIPVPPLPPRLWRSYQISQCSSTLPLCSGELSQCSGGIDHCVKELPQSSSEGCGDLPQSSSEVPAGRPPLPSYEEVIESRVRCVRDRITSWPEATHIQETEKKREAFMQLLAQRYPQYADKIQGVEASTASQPSHQERPSRSREGQRRRTAVVTYNTNQAANVLEYDDLGTMSDLELPSFQRGGLIRTSMPIVRSASTSLERPLGLVFLVHRDQTKKSMLPNEITTLDTVRALFVRAFPDLTLEMLENPRKKIYLLDPATNIYFQLEDLMDIKDRSVLKIHETDSDQPQKVKVRQEVRGRTVQMPATRSHSQQAYAELPMGHEVYAKTQSLPPQVAHSYPEMMLEQRNMWEIERRSRSRTPEMAERPRSLSAGASARQRYSHSPDRLPTPERVPLNPIPENRQLPPGYVDQGNYYETIGPGTYRGQYPSGIYDSAVPYQSYPPAPQIPPQQTYIARSTRAPQMAHPQRAIAPGPDIRDSTRGNNANRHSLAFAPMSVQQVTAALDGGAQQSQNYHIPSQAEREELTCSTTPADGVTRNRIEKMEQQLANLTAWVHYQKDGTRRESQSVGSTTSDGSDTLPASSASRDTGNGIPISTLAVTDHVTQSQGLSDMYDGSSNQRSSGLSSRESTPINVHIEINAKLSQLKSDLHILRRQQQLNMEAMRDEFLSAATKIKKIMSSVPGAQNQLNFQKRNEATIARRNYLSDKERIEKELSDLEASVEEVRADVISRQCRVNTSDVEGMALLLSNITKSLADLKANFPEIQNLMKNVMDADLRVVVSEEKFLKEEPTEIEHCLKRCKKITGTLYTLKRLASVQDHRPPHVPNIAGTTEVSLPDQKQAVLDNIRALVPDHEQRVKEMEAADASRERKKKITSQQEALKFGKSLEKASKNLRPPSLTDIRGYVDEDDEKKDEEGCRYDGGSQLNQVESTTSTKPTISSPSKYSPVSSTSVKPSLLLATAVKPLDKPTATVSAMTAGVSDTITMMATKTTERGSNPSSSIFHTQTTDCLAGGIAMGRSETHSIKVMTDSPKKKDAAVYSYQFSGHINHVFPVSTSPFQHEHEESLKFSEVKNNLHDVDFNKTKSDLKKKDNALPADVPLSVVTANKDDCSQSNSELPDDLEKVDGVTQRQALRSAFFSSLNTPPDSPSLTSPNRHSTGLELGPILSPSHGGKFSQGNTINLALSGTAVPKTSHSPGAFAISQPPDINQGMTTETRSAFSLQNSPARGIPRPVSESKTSQDHHLSSNVDSGSKQKKVPPPPPPRKNSRPTSANISPVNGPTLDLSQDMPQFVGGILGQHRHSGGPLFSTPKPVPQPKPASRFEQDIASGIYANMNRPDIQSQKSSPQQMMIEANIPNKVNSKAPSQSNISDDIMSIPPPPSVTIALDREERGSSSESSSSSSSSSGTSGSQQSVVSVIRSASTSDKGSSKSKPDPPKRQSSLLAKFTGFKESKSKVKNGKAKVNGVDL